MSDQPHLAALVAGRLPGSLTLAECRTYFLESPLLTELNNPRLRLRFVRADDETRDYPDDMTLAEFRGLTARDLTHIILDEAEEHGANDE